MENKRNFSRVDFKIDALLKVGEMTIKGEVKDLSLHGIFVQTTELIPVGTPVELTIYLTAIPPCIVVHINGVVVRSLEDGVGCTFDKMDAESFAHIRSILAYQSGDDEKVMDEFHAHIRRQSALKD